MKAVSALSFVLIQAAMYWNVQALTEFSGHNIIRYDYQTDYTAMGSVEDADNFCQTKGFKLVTRDELCPDGPNKPPVGGIIGGDQWVAVDDDIERYIQIGPIPNPNGDRVCKGHIECYGSKESWGYDGDEKEPHFNNQVFCSTPSPNPTPLPTPLPTAAPTPKATIPVGDAVGDGCKNDVKFSSSFAHSMGAACNACSLCAESSLSAIFNSSSQGICIDCAGIDNGCDVFEIVTTFKNEWAMKFISLVPSHAGSEYDPQTFTMEGSNEDDVWHKLLQNTVQFMGQKEPVDYPLTITDKKYKQYKVTFGMKPNALKMYIDHYAIISSYTKTCTSNIFEDITGKYVKPYKTI